MTTFQPFEMERMMSRFEQAVEYNLSESGVHPLFLRELVADQPGAIEKLLDTNLNYPHVNGTPELRENIARLYPGAKPENVLVTVGAIEANYNAIHTVLSPDDDIVIMLPNYMQIWGVAKNHNLNVKTFHLREEKGWAADLAELESQVTPETKLIAVCNPNNPTGYILKESEMAAIVGCAEKVGAWILADEVYRGADRTSDQENPSFYGLYDKVIAVGSMSKAYGLPGLRLGWAVAPENIIAEIWARHEYTTLSATMMSNKLATIALSPEVRPRIIQRTRDYIRHGFPILEAWVKRHEDTLSLAPPDAAAIAFIRYQLDINSTDLVNRLIQKKSVLIVPGYHFGMEHFLRISFGLPKEYLETALQRIHELIEDLQS